ncbi:pilin [Xylella taiwanensis]|uniref:Fimbrial protein n=1 Tax=Xylella taiwanensis TaxID=1444770 RepID=Z9JIC8_9GAMM|nr:pilin [Xylella taiwanensis]AXI83447.1 hypothetical protein AB672_05610 [Xylella taiwanensis]EWS77502.1 fimbrial protein [Xylella taiwanensis]MCD8456517.1 pilin [Xylella taiwanensis]MCD8458924.1 pilin [Xylella taiwanensis]MCD8461062.1 pilin [Xylella taiwanensis]
MENQEGFTLTEVLIVIAIIAGLAAIAVPIYRSYVARIQTVAALADITPGRTQAELIFNEPLPRKASRSEMIVDHPNQIGLPTSTLRCHRIMVEIRQADGVQNDIKTGAVTQTDSDTLITCTINGNALVNNKTISWHRFSTQANVYEIIKLPNGGQELGQSLGGRWYCLTDVAEELRPRNCRKSTYEFL